MDVLQLIFYFLIIIPSSILHEYAHGWMAERLGDPTARYAGRLTLDPRSHIDVWGTILMPLFLFYVSGGRFMFAYAKPVPYNPFNLRNQRWGPALVGAAGPLSNFLLAVVFALFVRFFPGSFLSDFLSLVVYANILLMIFNLVPIPPLDGSKVLFALLPTSSWGYQVRAYLERYGFFVLLIFIFFLFDWIVPVIDGLFHLLVG